MTWTFRLRLVCLLPLLGLGLSARDTDRATAQNKPVAPDKRAITIKLVTDFDTARPVSDLESLQPIKKTVFDSGGSKEITLGERCVLWVRNAHIDGKHFFERYYQEKYIGRSSVLDVDAGELGPGEHILQPGRHRFRVEADGKLTSDDPDIRVTGSTVLLRLHPVTVYAVDSSRSGPAEFRQLPADIGLLSLDPDVKLDPQGLPDPRNLHDPRAPAPKGPKRPQLTNVLSHQKAFYPLTVWLPANTEGQGYVLYPSWQSFHLRSDGGIDLEAGKAQKVAGVIVEKDRLLLPYRKFSGKLSTTTGMTGGVGSASLAPTIVLGATLAPLRFRAGFKETPEAFSLPVDTDLSKYPGKFFVADNTSGDRDAIRLLALEWQQPVWTRGQEAGLSLRLLEAAGKATLKKPEARVSWSKYNPSQPLARVWQPLAVKEWSNGRDQGSLRFQAPDTDFQFIALRVQVVEAGAAEVPTPLQAEVLGCVINPGQQGTASFATNKGRNSFICGEEIDGTLVLRSARAHSAGTCSVLLTHPDGQQETLTIQDNGSPWQTFSVRIPPARTLVLAPGRYTLSVRDLPGEMAVVPLELELVGRQKQSLFHIVKTSKYTRPMNEMELSHLQGKPVDLDRAMHTLADLGFNRVDLMTYSTNHHLRAYTWREDLAGGDPRLPAPDSVYTPTPREQILNACVRNQFQYSDVWLSYGDFHLPRSIEGYIRASERWIAREMQAMRHSPALDGLMLYDEMYQTAAVGIVKEHTAMFARIRARLAEEQLGTPPGKIEEGFNRYLSRPAAQRDPQALELFLKYGDLQQMSWADYVNRVVKVARELQPAARFGTYHRTWASPGANDDLYHGYPPDLFRSLDIISHVHYCDNSSCWVSIPLLAQALRTGPGKTLYVNMPLLHEVRTQWDGQYQRHMAFALLAQGANGIAQWGTPHTFEDAPNPGTAQGRDTTGPLNREILAPFGEIADRTQNGYRKVGIVSTKRQHLLNGHKQPSTPHLTEGIWIACWRLGYPAVFVREEQLQQKLDGFSVLFVPGVRFEGELDEAVVKRLREAIAAGVKVVVEANSVLDLPGLIKLKDWDPISYFLGDTYFPTWRDDELNKVYEKSQPIVDYLRPKFQEWQVEPIARGPFKVGPSFRDGGQAQYLIMANFEDPDYSHTVKQQMAKPVLMPLTVAAHRGKVAYDLLAQRELELTPVRNEDGRAEERLTLDMRRIQGAIVAFLPERVGKLQVRQSVSTNPGSVRIKAALAGVSGQTLDAVFPVRIVLHQGQQSYTFYRMLGRDLTADFDLPATHKQTVYRITVREALSGKEAEFQVDSPRLEGPSLQLVEASMPAIPRPKEVQGFLNRVKKAVLVPSPVQPGFRELAEKLQQRLRERGIEARIADEATVYRSPNGDPKEEDPFNDGFHSWHSGQETIAPALVVDEAVILLAGHGSSLLLDALAEHGYLSLAPLGGPGQQVRPQIQVAHKGLHFTHDSLCLIANEAEGLKIAIDALFAPLPSTPPLPVPSYSQERDSESPKTTATRPVLAAMGTNELVMDVQQDKAGNLYAITWGHGKNLYSFAPDGKPRFSRMLPQMGTNRLSVHDDRLYAYTSAGARLYRLTLDNKPVTQARLNMDLGSAPGCDGYELSSCDYLYLPGAKLLLHNQGDRLRLLDDDFRIVAEWTGEPYRDKDVSDEVLYRTLHGYALSPDGQRISQLEASSYFTKAGYQDRTVYDTHLVIRDLGGKLLAEHKNVDNGTEVTAQIVWPRAAAGPIVFAKEKRWAFDAELKLLQVSPDRNVLFSLGDDRSVVREDRLLLYQPRFGQVQCRMGPFEIIPTYAGLSSDGSLLALMDEYGLTGIYRTSDGARLASFQVSERGQVLRFTADNQRLIIGTFQGSLLAYDLKGQQVWHVKLGEFNDLLGQQLPLYDPSFADQTEKLWPVSRDQAGDLEKLVRLDPNRLSDGWKVQGGEVQYHNEGLHGGRCLKVSDGMASQEIMGFLGQHSTWVLDFHYRSLDSKAGPELLAGLMAQSDYPDSVARTFRARAEWTFGRVVIKSGSNCKKLMAGFAARGGPVLVDGVQLRRVRFPSINHLLFEPFHAVKPVVLDNPLFAPRYHPFGALKEQAPSKVLLQNTRSGSLPLVDSGFLQNGRLNDITSSWYIQPWMDELVISLGLKEPRWVNMVGLYFNAYEPDLVLPHFDILATDLEAKQDRLVASVRHNGQVFRLVKFAPVKTSLLKIRLVNSIARVRTLTEVEVYGPLSGREGSPGFEDPEGQNTYMGDFTRVDKRIKKWPTQFLQPLVVTRQNGAPGEDINWYAPLAQVLAAQDRFHVARAFGKNTGYTLAQPDKELYSGRACGLGFTPYGTLYGGLLLRSGNDGKLYCLNPDTGTELWSVRLAERLFGCPVVLGDDIFLAGDKGKLLQMDLASGGVLREVLLSGQIFGSLASDGKHLFFITDDGFLHCYRASDMNPVWKVEVAPFTDSTPAVDQGVVYLADQKGDASAVEVATGKVRWKTPLGDEFMRCPVVGPDKVVFGCRGGTLAVLDRASGKALWSRKVESRFDYEPLLIEDTLLYFRGNKAMKASVSDGKESAFEIVQAAKGQPIQSARPFALTQDPIVSISWYKGNLFFIDRPGEAQHNEYRINFPWHVSGGSFSLLRPAPEEAAEKGKK
jgi:outer membrane protein assembly factor BamB